MLGVGEILALCREKVTTALLGGLGPVNQALLISGIQQLHIGPRVRVFATRPAWACTPVSSAQLRLKNSFLFSFSNKLQNTENIFLNLKTTFIL